ncbi:MAG: hypothetical protein KC414_04295, partial [Romboutsia sp.]|nr:hypothetical protein [Romboutsia sp.]
MYKSNILQFLFYLSIGTTLSAQTIYENDINVNKFLLRLNQKQIISLNESVFPISNDLIKINLNPNISNLTEIDIEEAAWYLEKYSLEIGNKSSILGELNLIEDNFKLRLKPIFGYCVSAV